MAASERLQEAVELAHSRHNATIEPIHLLASILHSTDSINQTLLERAGVNISALKSSVDVAVEKLPTITGSTSEPSGSQELAQVLKSAEKSAQKMGDSYITEEHLMMGLLDSAKSLEAIWNSVPPTRGVSTKEAGGLLKAFEEAVKKLRNGKKVTSNTAENLYESLKKYTIDLIEQAKQGKIDPIIGRDEEIRRSIQILARRTKNNPVLIGDPGVGKTAIVE